MHYLLSFLFLVLVSCVTTEQKLSPEVYYVHDLAVRVDGRWIEGMGVIPLKKSYRLKVKSPGQMTTLLITTCHRQIKVNDAGRREIIQFDLNPDEMFQNCGHLRFSAFDKKHGKHAQAQIWIDHGVYKLNADLYCNGSAKKYGGVSACHALEGLYQRIVFQEDVILMEENNPDCKISSDKNGFTKKRKVFRFKIPNRECQFRFVNRKRENHFLYTSGYEENIIRN